MKNLFRKYGQEISRVYLVIIGIAALFFQRVVYYGFYSLNPGESIAFTKAIPVSVAPVLVFALLAAFFVTKGHSRAVGLGGLLLITAAAIVAGGSMMWMHSVTMNEQEALLTTLSGYELRQPLALFLVACAFMRGGACSLLISVFSSVRQSPGRGREGLVLAVAALLAAFLAIWVILIHEQLTWSLCAGLCLIQVMALFPSLIVELLQKEAGGLETGADWQESDGGPGIKGSILPVFVLAACGVCLLSYWKYIPYCWGNRVWSSPLAYYTFLSVSLVTLAAGLVLIRRRLSRGRDMRGLPVIGGLFLVMSLPLTSLFLREEVLELVPQMMTGAGAAMVIGPTLDALVGVRTRWYPFVWVGFTWSVIWLASLVAALFGHMEWELRSGDVAAYILFPIMGLVLVIMSYYMRESDFR